MIVRQLLHTEPAVAASYFVACAGQQAAAVIDPVADPEVYARIAAETETTIRYVPEHIALVVTDRSRAAEPWLVLTGHTLMVGDMGRTELASSAEDGARALFDSAERLRSLPSHVQVLPGAFAGSVCGRGLSGTPFSTIGFERRFNRAFAITDRAAFVEYMLREIPPRPEGAAEHRSSNLGIPVEHRAAQTFTQLGVTAGGGGASGSAQ